jgi:hypothetical protein
MIINIKLPTRGPDHGHFAFETQITDQDSKPFAEVTKIQIGEIDYSSDQPVTATMEVIVNEIDLEHVDAELYTTIGGKRYRLVELA